MTIAITAPRAKGAQPEIGSRFQRWRVVRHVHAARRRPTDTGVRARVECQCVCGRTQVVWVEDLVRWSGCDSRRCRARWQMGEELRSAFYAWLGAVRADFEAWLTEWFAGLDTSSPAWRTREQLHRDGDAWLAAWRSRFDVWLTGWLLAEGERERSERFGATGAEADTG